MPYWMSIVVSQAIGMLYGFAVFRAWAFSGAEKRPIVFQINDFLLVNLAGALATFGVAIPLRALLAVVLGPLLAIDSLAHALGIGVGAVVNYRGHKQFTFRRGF